MIEVGQDVPGSAFEGSAMRASSMHVCGKSGRVIVVMSWRRVFLPRLGSRSR